MVNNFEKAQAIIAEAFPFNNSRFMEPVITEHTAWIELDGSPGITYIEKAYWEGPLDNTQEFFAESGIYAPGQYEVNEVEGYGARMSAPGYSDCTEWSVFDTPEEAAQYLADHYAEEEEEDDGDDEPDPEFDLIQTSEGYLGSRTVYTFAGKQYPDALEAMQGIMRHPTTYVLPSRIFRISDHGNVIDITWESFCEDVAACFTADPGTNYADDSAAIYNAAMWCPSCAERIALDLLREKGWDAYSPDSDTFPQYVLLHQDETDSPQHCDAGPECLEASILADGSKVGKLLNQSLTEDGDRYVKEAYREDPTNLVVKLWLEHYDYLADELQEEDERLNDPDYQGEE